MKRVIVLALALLSVLGLAACGKTEASIKAYTRDTASGTREAFFEGISFKDAQKANDVLVDGFVEVESNGAMINGVKNDENGIGYISLSSLNGSGIKGLKFAGVEATEANVLNNTYQLKRPFNYIVRDDVAVLKASTDKADVIAAAFVAYMGTKEGKATIKAKGGIVTEAAADPSWATIKGEYEALLPGDNSSVTVKFGGSTSVESIAKALSAELSPLLGNFKAEHGHTGSGDAYKNTQGSEKDGANKVHVAFASRAFSAEETAGSADGSYGQLSWDAVVAVVNNVNTIVNITAAELKAIYSGTTTKWSELA